MNLLMEGILESKSPALVASVCGAKAAGLLYLQTQGFQVPPFYLLPYSLLQQVQQQKQSLDKLLKDWREQNGVSPESRWAVRSSAGVEDGQQKSYAGLFTTRTNVCTDALAEAILAVLAAFEPVKTLRYDSGEDFPFGIILQQMLRPDYSGVVFSHNPLNPRDPDAYANFVPGLGEALVSGRAEAFMVKASPQGRFSFLNADQTFTGELFTDQLTEIQREGSEMKTALSPLLRELFAGSRKLAQQKSYPVDCEFAVADGQLYWLQVRPITSPVDEDPVSIWDNSNIGENFPGLTLPLSISFTQRSYATGYSSMARFLGMRETQIQHNLPLFQQMVGGIYGALYYHVTAWQQLLYQLPFGKRISSLITRVWNADDAAFAPPAFSSSPWMLVRFLWNLIGAFVRFGPLKQAFESIYEREIAGFDRQTLVGKSHAELVAIYEGFEERLGNNWTVPMLNGFYTMVLFSALKKIFRRSRLYPSHPNFINDILFSQGDVISVRIVRDFQALCQAIQTNKNLRQLFEDGTPASIWEKLAQNYPDFRSRLDAYIEDFGERSAEQELKMETVNFKEDPLLFIAFVQSNALVAHERKSTLRSFDYWAILKQAYRYSPFKRWILRGLIRITLPRFRDRENYRFSRTKTFDIARCIFRNMDKHLVAEGWLMERGDSFYLTFSELMDPTQNASYRERVAQRKEEYAHNAGIEHAPRYVQTKQGFTPVWPMESLSVQDTLQGVGCCSGVVRGRVSVVDSARLEETEGDGGIFVAHHFEPGWINLFAKASGILSERGNLLSHTAILCREMGIPSIVGVKGLMKRVQEGDEIQMNGATGEVQWIVPEKES